MTDPALPDVTAHRAARGTPVRNVRLTDDTWARVTAAAAATGSTASDVIRAALDALLDA